MHKQFEDFLIKLSNTDKQILASYCVMCDCLSLSFGDAYEIVLHSLGKGDRFIIKIINGDYSGRSTADVVDRLSVIAIEHLHAMLKHNDLPTYSWFSPGINGGMVKSTSVGITNGGKRLIGMLCLNFYLDTPISKLIEALSLPKLLSTGLFSACANNEQRYDATLYKIIENAKQTVMNNPDIPNKFKRKEIIRLLNESGIFGVKKGVAICAEMLGITITTIYMHIRNLDISIENKNNEQ